MRIVIVTQRKTGGSALMHATADAYKIRSLGSENQSLKKTPEKSCVIKWVSERYLGSKTIADFNANLGKFDARIFLVRDPRDILISHMFYMTYVDKRVHRSFENAKAIISFLIEKQQSPEQIPFSEMVRVWNQYGSIDNFKGVRMNNKVLLKLWRRFNDQFFLYSYEDMVQGNFSAISQYLGAEVTEPRVRGKFVRVVRSKKINNWQHWFHEADNDIYSQAFRRYMKVFGYEKGEVAKQQVIDVNHAAGYLVELITRRDRNVGAKLVDYFKLPKQRKGYD